MDTLLKHRSLYGNSSSHEPSDYVGFICAGVAVIFFGSNFVPVKRYPYGDGVFFQWILCWIIWCCGLVVNIWRNNPQFYPLVMTGGALWAIGNAFVAIILKAIGLAQGLLIWGTSCLVFGWAISRFGLFGIESADIHHSVMNYIGVVLCVGAGFCYFLLKTNEDEPTRIEEDDDPLLESIQQDEVILDPIVDDASFVTNLSPRKKMITGKILACFSGLCYSVNFVPILYIQSHKVKYPDASQDMLDYVFAHFSGIFVTSSVIFLAYAVYMRNHPRIYPELILPTVASAVAWSIAGVSWFIATKTLSQAVAFPIINTGPGAIGALWGVFYFKEIRGHRNYIILLFGISVTICGCIVTAMSIL